MNNENFINTDLALERVPQNLRENTIEGAIISTEKKSACTITDITVQAEPAISVIGKPCGRYITVETENHFDENAVAEILSEQILKLTDKNIKSVLVAGLGNRHITSDSLGAKTSDKVCVTRILSDYIGLDTKINVSAVSPGVLGETGIETLEILSGICLKIKPDTVIAVDSLCAKDIHRIANTFQLTDTGINPGAGLGNMRKSLTKDTLGCKVIGIGVPTVVYARTIWHNITQKINAGKQEEINSITEELDDSLVRSLVVTPKDIDSLSNSAANIISRAINIAFDTLKFS